MGISRILAESEVVHGFDSKIFHSCTVSGFTSACGTGSTGGAFPFSHIGRIIDRFGLRANFNAVKPVISAYGNVLTSVESTAHDAYMALGIGLQHSATTCSADFADYSTGDWVAEQPLQVVTTATSTGASYYTAEGAEVSAAVAGALSTALSSSTSTAYAALASYTPSAFALQGANRFLRIVLQPRIETTGCGGSNMTVQGGLVFGYPDETPQSSLRGRVFVTSACST